MEVTVREIVAQLVPPPILIFSTVDAVADGSRPFHVHRDAFMVGVGAAFEHELSDGPVRPILYSSRATFDHERHWAPLDLEAGSLVGAIKRLRGWPVIR